MDADRWQRLAPWLDELLDAPPDTRVERLAALRAQDARLADELQRLIALEDGNDDFLSEPVVNPQAAVRPGVEIGPYRLERLLGEGGMGQVWLAERSDGLLQRRIALKLLRPGLVESDLRGRFGRERQILARLAHPYIARLLDAGTSRDGVPYLALDYIDGIPLTDWCRAQAAPLEVRLRMLGQVCDAVSHAHANLVVHRDLKPSNILVTPAGEVRLLDFGIAKLLDGSTPAPENTRTGARAFTLHYAAPEQIRGEAVTTMTDVYALGVVLYELLTDRKPYRPQRRSDAAWEEAILTHAPLRPSQQVQLADVDTGDLPQGGRRRARALAGDLDNIALKALAKRPDARYASAEAFWQDLQNYLAGKPVVARSGGMGRRLGTLWRRRRTPLLGVAGAVATVALAFGVLAWQAQRAQREAAYARAAQRAQAQVLAAAVHEVAALPNPDLPTFLDAAAVQAAAWPSPAQRRAVQRLLVDLHLQRGDVDAARALLARAGTQHWPTATEALEMRLLAARVDWADGDAAACVRRLRAGLREVRALVTLAPSLAGAVDAQHARCLPRGDPGAAPLLDRAAARYLLAGDAGMAARIRAERRALDARSVATRP